MKYIHIIKLPLMLTTLVVLSGCVAGQSIRMDYKKPDGGANMLRGSASVVVDDNRSFIKNRSKSPAYIGHFRAALGNTWGVTTYKNVPLAKKMQKDLAIDLGAMGLDTTKGGNRSIHVSIVDWNFDAYSNARFWYEIKVTVKNGTKVVEDVLKGEQAIRGSVMTGPKSAVKRELPIAYNAIIRKIARENPKILAALK